jgi:hypothetical protein
LKFLQNVADVFSILHDGTIVGWNGDEENLTLAIECQYLAVKINPSFDRFYVELININNLSLSPWMNPFDLKQEYFVELKKIFQAELEILSAEIEDNIVKVSCNQHNLDFNFCGGILYLNCFDIRVYDQDRRELSIEELNAICKSYWNEIFR